MESKNTLEQDSNGNAFRQHRFGIVVILLLSALLFFVRVHLSKTGPITWDEPVYLNASRAYARWGVKVVKGIFTGHPFAEFQREKINEHWRRHLPSPPFAKTINGITWLFLRPIFGDLAALRAGSALALAGLFAAVLCLVLQKYGAVGAIAAGCMILFNPRLFSHAGTANLDTIGMVLAFLALFYFWKTSGRAGWKVTIITGILWGLSISAKNSAILMLPFLFLWTIFWRRTAIVIRRLLFMQLIAGLVFVAVWPWMYHDTVKNLSEFGRWAGLTGLYEKATSVLEDESEAEENVDTKLGRRFGASMSGIEINGKRGFPWYYSLAVMGVVLPVPSLILFLLGTAILLRTWKHSDAAFFVLGAWYPLLITTLPFLPIYDMERFLLISMPFIAILAASAAASVQRALTSIVNLRSLQFNRMLAISLLILPAYAPMMKEWMYIHPIGYSYFNFLAGGLPGAVQKGFPRNYWLQSHWGVLWYLNNALPYGSVVSVEETAVLNSYKEFGLLRQDLSTCRVTNAASAKKCEYFVRREPLNPDVLRTANVLYTFALHGVPLSSVHDVTEEWLEMKSEKEREKRKRKRQEKRELDQSNTDPD